MERQLRTKLKYRDVLDVEGYVRKVARSVVPAEAPHDDFEQIVADGLAFAALLHGELEPCASLRRALGQKLGNHLRDCYRDWRTDIRRNARAGTTTVATPTGMAHEYGRDRLDDGGVEVVRTLSRLALADATEARLRDPQWVGRWIAGVPSYRPLATGAAREAMAKIEDERALAHSLKPLPDEYLTPLTDDLP